MRDKGIVFQLHKNDEVPMRAPAAVNLGQLDDHSLDGYAVLYRAYLARRPELPGTAPLFADFVAVYKFAREVALA